LRQLSVQGNLFIFQNSLLYDNNYSSFNAGFLTTFLYELVKGKHFLCKRLISSTNPFFLVGNSLFHRYDFKSINCLLNFIQTLLVRLFKKSLYINYLHNCVNSVGTLELGLLNSSFFQKNNKKCLFWLDQSFFLKKSFFFKNSFNICCSSFGFDMSKKGDILLPTTLFLEEDSLFYNCEGKINFVKKGLPNDNLTMPLWQILIKLLFFFKRRTNFGSVAQLVTCISSFLPRTKSCFDKIKNDSFKGFNFKFFEDFYFVSLSKQKLFKTHYKIYVYDFYKSHFLCESSILMNKASLLIRRSHINYSFLKKNYS